MAKQQNRKLSAASSRPKGRRPSRARIAGWLDLAGAQIVRGDIEEGIQTAQRVLRYVPPGSPPYAEAQERLGMAYGLLRQFDASYDAFTRALETEPKNARLWHNRALTGRYLFQLGQSLRDLERAVVLESRPELLAQYQEALAFGRKLVQGELALRGPDFTLDRLIEQQALMRKAVRGMEAGAWVEAEAALRRVIALADVLPQIQGNLAGCLIYQERYDEAEAALRRALEIDPNYEIARRNLKNLPYLRRHGPAGFEMSKPFQGAKLKLGLTFFEE